VNACANSPDYDFENLVSDDVIDIKTFRRGARSWLEGNLERRDASKPVIRPRGVDHETIERIDEQRKIQRKLCDGGYAGISYPKQYGGRGLTVAHEQAFNDEAADYVVPEFGVLGRTTGTCSSTLLAHASSEFLKRHIPRILAGEELWVQFFSEPEAGSDLAGVRTRATRDGRRWILSGSKIWSSGASFADYGLCLARTNWVVPKHRGLTWFAVPTTARGVTIRPIKQINGDAEFCEEFLDDVELGDEDIIGEVDGGWAVAQTMLVFERQGGSSSLPVPSRQHGPVPDLLALARQVGREKDPVVRQLIARAHINDFARHQLTRRITSLMHESNGMEAGIAAYGKLAEGTLAPIRARIALEIGRGGALLWDRGDIKGMAPSLNYLNGRIMSIAGGTNEMQRNAIGERVLGLPREPSFDTKKPFSEVIRDVKNWTQKGD
jgi:alkylation response protein AidB-like acyl-CoA dehydrogenase